MRKHPWLICYDIRSPRRLQRVHKVVSGYGVPVQYSVFYAELTETAVESLIKALEEAIDEAVDDVRIYGVESLDKAEIIGETKVRDFLMKNRRHQEVI